MPFSLVFSLLATYATASTTTATSTPLLPPSLLWDTLTTFLSLLTTLFTTLILPIVYILYAILSFIIIAPLTWVFGMVWGWIPMMAFFATAILLGMVLGGVAGWSVEEVAKYLGVASSSSPAAKKSIQEETDVKKREQLEARMRTETMDTYATQRLTGLPPAHIRRRLRGMSVASSVASSHLASRFGENDAEDEEGDGWEEVLGDMTPDQISEFLERISKSSEKTDEVFGGRVGAEVESLDLGAAMQEDEGMTVRKRGGYGVDTSD